MYMSVHILVFNTRYAHMVPAYNGTHFQLGRLQQLGITRPSQGLNMMAPVTSRI
jgi:hypothetical protein